MRPLLLTLILMHSVSAFAVRSESDMELELSSTASTQVDVEDHAQQWGTDSLTQDSRGKVKTLVDNLLAPTKARARTGADLDHVNRGGSGSATAD